MRERDAGRKPDGLRPRRPDRIEAERLRSVALSYGAHGEAPSDHSTAAAAERRGKDRTFRRSRRTIDQGEPLSSQAAWVALTGPEFSFYGACTEARTKTVCKMVILRAYYLL